MWFDLFDRVVCINLSSRPDRWKQVRRELRRIGLQDVRRFDAIKRKRGIRGCTMSHVQVVQEALDDKLSNILIFEDDVQFVNYDEKIIEGALEQLFSLKWDMFYLGSSSNSNFRKFSKYLLKPTSGVKATHAYALNSSVFQQIIDHKWVWQIPDWESLDDNSLRLAEHIDKFYRDILIPNCRCFHINPIQAVQRKSYSDVQNKVMDYSKWQVDRFEERVNG